MSVSAPPRSRRVTGSLPARDETSAVAVPWRKIAVAILAALAVAAAWVVTTNTYAVLAQQGLADRWEAVVARGDRPAAVPGEPVARLSIPALGLERVVVEGTDRAALRRAPGHRPGTALPGEAGNSVIQGHRLLWSAPFRGIDGLNFGSPIHVELADGRVVTYLVAGIFRMDRDDPNLLDDSSGRWTLSLVTSDPPFRADRLLIVRAVLPPAEES